MTSVKSIYTSEFKKYSGLVSHFIDTDFKFGLHSLEGLEI